jgi:hypothetical protein
MNPSEHVDQLIADLTDWRGKAFANIRKSILEADREIIENYRGRQRSQEQAEAYRSPRREALRS